MINDRLVDIAITASEAIEAAAGILGELGVTKTQSPSIRLRDDGSAVVTLTIAIEKGD